VDSVAPSERGEPKLRTANLDRGGRRVTVARDETDLGLGVPNRTRVIRRQVRIVVRISRLPGCRLQPCLRADAAR